MRALWMGISRSVWSRIFAGTLSLCAAGLLLAQDKPAETPNLVGHADEVYTLDFSPDGALGVTGSFDRTLKLWDMATRKPVRTLTGHTNLVLSVAVSKDGKQIASGSLDNTVKVWDVPVNVPEKAFPAHAGGATAVALIPDGTLVATGGADKLVKLWTVADGKVARELPAGSTITRIDFRKDGMQVAAGTDNGLVNIWKPQDGVVNGLIGAHPGPIVGVAFHPNNQTLMTAGAEGIVKFWPVAFTPARPIPGHTAPIATARISPNGQSVLSSSADKTVRLWTLADGKQVRTFDGHPEVVNAIAWGGNSAQLATGCDDKIARVFDANTGMLIKELPAQAGAP